jgi:hypothetical protein
VEVLELRGRSAGVLDAFDFSGHGALDQYAALRELHIGDYEDEYDEEAYNEGVIRPIPPVPPDFGRLTKLAVAGLFTESPYLLSLLSALSPTTSELNLFTLSDSPLFVDALEALHHPTSIRQLSLGDPSETEEMLDLPAALTRFSNLEVFEVDGSSIVPSSVSSFLATTALQRLKLYIGAHISTSSLLTLLRHPQRRQTLRLLDLQNDRPPSPCHPTRSDLSSLIKIGGSSLSDDALLETAFPSDFWCDEFTPRGLLDVLETAAELGVVVRGDLSDALRDKGETDRRIEVVRRMLKIARRASRGRRRGKGIGEGEGRQGRSLGGGTISI